MIKGIGIDLVDLERMKKFLTRHSDKSLEKVFTKNELKLKERPERLAGRFAAKEALSKALGTGLGAQIWFNEIEVENEENGRPKFVMTHKLQKILQKEVGAKKAMLSISHEKSVVTAIVILE